MTTEITSVFAETHEEVYCHRFRVQLTIGHLVGGTPTDQNVAEGWIRTKMGVTNDEAVQAEVAKVMQERGVTGDEAAEVVARNRSLTGFKRDFTTPVARNMQELACTRGVKVRQKDGSEAHKVFTPQEAEATFGELYIEGRQIKAMFKEAASISVAAGRVKALKWGKTNKSMLNFLVEHLFVLEECVYLGVTDPDRVNQSFVHTFRGSGIKLEEIVDHAVVDFTLVSDYDFPSEERNFYPQVFVTGELNGLGASRSQGFGTFKVTRFEEVDLSAAEKRRASKLKAEVMESQAEKAVAEAAEKEAAAAARRAKKAGVDTLVGA